MKRLPCGCVAALALAFCAAAVFGCAENNEESVTGGQGSMKVEGAAGPQPQTQQELAEQYKSKGTSGLVNEGYPGASRNLGTSGAAPKETPKETPKEAPKEEPK